MWVVEHLGVGGAPLCLETSMDLTDELRMLAEDLHVNGYNRYSAAMYGTLSTSFVRDTVRIARGEQE